jgi:CRISPR/Cas system CSM-associated protein Csm3 (group 7 of RAMP superfamily)
MIQQTKKENVNNYPGRVACQGLRSIDMKEHQQYKHKIKITGTLTFETAFHIGSGKEGELATNMGVLIGADGAPILPGSTLKGNFRSFGERLAPVSAMKRFVRKYWKTSKARSGRRSKN